ncbi:rod-binding protein [Pirellulaceae bacterium SH501]
MSDPIGSKHLDSMASIADRSRSAESLLSHAKGLEGKSFAETFLQESFPASGTKSAAEPSGSDRMVSNEGILNPVAEQSGDELQEAFQNFVGQTLFSQMISSLRSSQEGSAYFNGGRAEKIFQGQLDQILSEEMTKASASQLAEPMYDLFQLQRNK